MATATFQVDSYQYYNWSSSRKTGKTNLVLKGAGGPDMLHLVCRGCGG
jgi:hypothetical protein